MKIPAAIAGLPAFFLPFFLALACFLAGVPEAWAEETSGSLTGQLTPPGEITAEPEESMTELLEPYLGLPFRADGAIDLQGRWVTFNDPETEVKSAGFNCSGFTVAAARALLKRDFDLLEVSRDRLGDSGPEAPLGRDWDFGLDLILNLAQDFPHRMLPPQPDYDQTPIDLTGNLPLGWGVNIHGPELETLLAEIRPGSFCFFAMSKPDLRFPGGVSYYHVGLIVSEPPDLWLYHTTRGARTNRVNLAAPKGLARLRRDFKPISKAERRLMLIEVSR